ncbi:MAG: hypothetical protein FGM33_08395 [Candidatus Kapabacteria bacterium]|nr:hypothetical protein [Candidatus Kapabacteria bacterium]
MLFRILLTLGMISLRAVSNAQPGDTILVKTLTFKDTTKRSGTWLFPPPQRYEKVVMLYTLKCDPATTQDRFDCGEWDYLTYTMLRDSTGEFDSTRMMQPNYRVKGATPDSFSYASTFIAPRVRYQTTSVTRAGGRVGDFAKIGSGGQSNVAIIRTTGGRGRFVWKGSELKDAGVAQGPIHGISINALEAGAVTLMTVRLRQATFGSAGRNVERYLDNGADFQTVVRRNVTLVKGENRLAFSAPFNWDGVSDIVIDFGCMASTANIGIDAGAAMNIGTVDDGSRRAFQFTSGDAMVVRGDIGAQLSDEITISFWCWGDPNKMPRAHNTMEAYDAQGRRVVNIHLPWDNQVAYWDCGYDPKTGAYDRIEKGAPVESTEGRWNHWVFTKNKAGTMRIYLNGSLFHEGNGKLRKLSGISRFLIGSGGSASYEGLLDEFQVWSIALDSTTIKSWMHRTITEQHPQYPKLIAYYRPEVVQDGAIAVDQSLSGFNATLFGMPTVQRLAGDQLGHQTVASSSRPVVGFETGTEISVSTVRGDLDVDVEPRRTSLELFERKVDERIYQTDAADHPTVASDTLVVQEAGVIPVLNENGLRVDSITVTAEKTIRKVLSPYFSPIVDFEIGRYITPYGIGLDLGPKGFRWEVDVTDFAPLLRNNVTLSAGNQQELIDLTFMFIKGTPPRDVKQIDQVIYERGAWYPDVLANKALAPVTVALNPDAKMFRIKTMTSGHEFSNATNCAEFCPRNHFVALDGTERFTWRLWKECGDNPVYPQGGTWLIDRTGWCPGEMVDLYEFDATPFTQGKSQLTIDYGIKKEAAEENWGRWEVSTQLIGYGVPNFTTDVAITDIRKPNSWEYYSRMNPICGAPEIVIQNTGSKELTECTITYGANGAKQSTFTWKGKLGFLERDTVMLPVPTWPTASGNQTFTATLSTAGDEYAKNNTRSTAFVMPPSYYGDLQIALRTNRQAEEQYSWRLTRSDGTVIQEVDQLESEKLFTYDLNLEPGCYEFELINRAGYGLDFWFLRDQLGTGSLLLKSGGNTIKTFEPDFGNRAWIQFTVAIKPTIQVSTDTVTFETPTPTKVERRLVIRAANKAGLRVDSLSAFSVRKHFSVVSTSLPLPANIEQGDSLVVILAFERPDAGTTSGSLRIFSNDERNAGRQVRLLGTVGTTSVEEQEPDLSTALSVAVVPNPVIDRATIKLDVFRADLLRGATVSVRDIMGRTVAELHSGDLSQGEADFDMPSMLAAGTYLVVVESGRLRTSLPFIISR